MDQIDFKTQMDNFAYYLFMEEEERRYKERQARISGSIDDEKDNVAEGKTAEEGFWKCK